MYLPLSRPLLPWSKFESTVAEAQTLAQPEEFDYLALLDDLRTLLYRSSRRYCSRILNSMPQLTCDVCVHQDLLEEVGSDVPLLP